MGDGRERSEDRSNDDATPIANTGVGAMTPGKRTLTEQLSPAPASAKPGAVGGEAAETAGKKPTIPGTIIEGGALSDADVDAINEAAPKVPKQFRRYVAYAGVIKVGGSLAWRANNPGNLRDADTKIGTVHGAVGTFAVFANMEAGRAAQRALYLNKYGSMKVRDAIEKLTPPSENDTATYLKRLEQAGVDLDKDVKSQIDTLMSAVEANEGMITGVEIARAA
ncbi:MAG TPA: hypothetical protein VFD36_21625 [Kofleriaceae bacterium]|nr:hypothetical protein [Kofleriaceae bacterium]